jgi:hypothetical protein
MTDLFAIAGLILFSPLIIASTLLNNADLRAFERSFAAIEHPPVSVSLATSSRFGNLGCASNHCDYFVGNLRSSHLSQDDLLAHYKEAALPSPDPFIEGPIAVDLWFFDDEILECTPEVDGLFNRQADWGVDLSEYKGKTLYIAYAEAAGAPPGADIRCH